MADLDKETVDFVANYDETTEEPTVLPAPIPNLLVNGSSGIAVGMATNVPPHNLKEVIDGVIWAIEQEQAAKASGEPAPHAAPSALTKDQKIRGLMERIPGPDFPTGGFIVGRAGIASAYHTGRGAILMRAKATIEQNKKGDRQSIVVTEIPYQVNKARLIEKIAELVSDKVIEGISDLRDESDREGMRDRHRAEARRGGGGHPQQPLQAHAAAAELRRHHAGHRRRPAEGAVNLAELVDSFVDFRREVVVRRTQFELRKAEARYHILEGLKIALDQLDAVIKLIRGSKTVAEARDGLIAQFSLSLVQSQAILDMQLQRLTGLERQKILDEMAELLKTIERLRAILGSETLLMQTIVGELRDVQRKYGDDRRTADHRRQRRAQHRGPDRRGRHGDHGEQHRLHQADADHELPQPAPRRQGPHRHAHARRGFRQPPLRGVHARLHHDFLGPRPRVLAEGARDSRRGARRQRAKRLRTWSRWRPEERIASMLAVKEFEEGKHIVMGTLNGVVKKTELTAFSNPRAGGIIAMGVEDGDRLMAAQITDGTGEVFIGTRDGVAIRFPESDVRPMGRSAYGVKGISLREGDEVVAMEVVRPGSTLLTVTEHGYGKRTELDEYRVQSRGGVGIINIQTSERNGRVVGMASVHDEDEFMLITQQGKILRTVARDIRTIGRATQGVRLIEMDADDRVVSLARLAEKDDENGNGTEVTN